MIYILGVNNHYYQAINPSNNPYEPEFYDYVLEYVRAKEIRHLAEEMNDEFLQRENDAEESVCRKLANDLGITHSMCEPNTVERRRIGYVDKSREEFMFEDETGSSEKVNEAYSAFHRGQWHIRENFWFEKLQPHLSNNVLFICGAAHVDRFSDLLKGKGIKIQVVHRRWKPRGDNHGQS